MKNALLFTGQGSQHPNMLNELVSDERAVKMFREASDILNLPVTKLDSKEALSENQNVQLCIFLREMLYADRLMEEKSWDMVSGHSIGSFAAACVAGALAFEDAVRLVYARGSWMQEAFPHGYGMMAFTRIDARVIEKEIAKYNAASEAEAVVYPAVINAPDQLVASGSLVNLERFADTLHPIYYFETKRVRISVPSHCPLMDEVSVKIQELVEHMELKTPSIRYVSNYSARRGKTAALIREDLIHGVAHTVRWYDGITLMKECGVEIYQEVGGSHILTDIGRSVYPKLQWKN